MFISHCSHYLGSFLNQSTTLYDISDTLLIEHRLSLDFNNDTRKFYNHLRNLMNTIYAQNISGWAVCPSSDPSEYLACSAPWIREDAAFNCARVYFDEDGNPMNKSQHFHLGQTYYTITIDVVEVRLIQGGVRLGAVINKIVEL